MDEKDKKQLIKTYLNSLNIGIAVFKDKTISVKNKIFKKLMSQEIKSNVSQFYNVFRVRFDIGNSNENFNTSKEYTLHEMVLKDPEFHKNKIF